MNQFLHVFFVNLVTGIDNVVIIGGLVRKSYHPRWLIILYSAVLLTISRTGFIFTFHSVTHLTGLRLILGCTVLWIAIKMAMIDSEQTRRKYPLLPILLLITMTDLALSFDNILSISVVSHDIFKISSGVFFSTLLLLLLLPVTQAAFIHVPWLRILVAGLITQLSVELIAYDPILQRLFNNGVTVQVISIGAASLVILFGISYMILKKG